MRYFVLGDSHENVAVVFHDHISGSVICRSVKDSFKSAFDVVSSQTCLKFEKRKGLLRAVAFFSNEYSWIDVVLSKLSFWRIVDQGEALSMEHSIDTLVSQHLASPEEG